MNNDEGRREQLISGPVGLIQLLIDEPVLPAVGIAVVSHPHPLLGGSPYHVVPVTLARKLTAEGWRVVRPSFRGVGKTLGEHADGRGEADDSIAVVEHLQLRYPDLPIALVGFSFGAYVFAQVASTLEQSLHAVALLGLPVGEVPGGRFYPAQAVPSRCLLLHGEEDQMAPLADLLDWARPDHRPVVVFSGAGHFFKGCLGEVVERVAAHLNSTL